MFNRTDKELSRPPFIVDHSSVMRDTGYQVDWNEIIDDKFRHGSTAVVVDAAAAADATSVTVEALTIAIASGTTIYLGVAKTFMRLTEPGEVGDTTLTVEALATALAGTETGYTGGTGGKFLPAGTEVDLLANGKVVPSSLGTSGVTCLGLLETNAEENAPTDATTGYSVILSGVIYENLLPEADLTADPPVITAAHKTELLDRGGFWLFKQYADTTS